MSLDNSKCVVVVVVVVDYGIYPPVIVLAGWTAVHTTDYLFLSVVVVTVTAVCSSV